MVTVITAAVILLLSIRCQRRDAPICGVLLLLLCSKWIVPWYLTWLIFGARYAHRRAAIAPALIGSLSLLLEAKNQVTPARIELIQTLAFLTCAAIALRWAGSAGSRLTLRPWAALALHRRVSKTE